MGINSASSNGAEAMIFAQWLTTSEFVDLYAIAATGFLVCRITLPILVTLLQQKCSRGIRNVKAPFG